MKSVISQETYDKFAEELLSGSLGVVAQSSQSPASLSSSDLFGFNQLLDHHDSGVATRLNEAVDEQSAAKD